MTIDEVDRRLASWAGTVLGKVAICFDAPGKPAAERSVGLYLLELAPLSPPRGSKAAPLQFGLRYMVTTAAEDAAAAHRDLGELAFAALANPEFEVDFEPLPAATWAAFGAAPRPAFSIRMPLRKARTEHAVQQVRQPLVLEQSPIVGLRGAVLGPGDVPLSGAWVELASLGQSTHTDHKGRFRFAGVPAQGSLRLRVRAKGVEQEFASDVSGGSDQPLLLRLNL